MNLHSDPMMIPVISYIDSYTKTAINHDLEHSSITNSFLIVLYHVVQLRFDNSQYTIMFCYVMLWHFRICVLQLGLKVYCRLKLSCRK